MPEKVIPKVEDFESFKKEMNRLDFREYGIQEFKKQFQRLGLKAPRPQTGREVGFTFWANDLTIFVWTTWLAESQTIRESDAGWVVIIQEKKAVYFSHPLYRTKKFFLNLLRQAWLARWRAVNRPLCPECKKYMRIVRGLALKSRYWRCSNYADHALKKAICVDWDLNLPPEAKKYVDSARKARAKYRKKMKENGRSIYPAILRRKPWATTKPQNL